MSDKLRHIAVIMDGNGRWAQSRGHNRLWGHVRGANVARKIIKRAAELKLPFLTLFAFSTENWQRPKDEVEFLMRLLSRQLKREVDTLMKNNIRFHCVGNIQELPLTAQKVVMNAIEKTKNNSGTQLIFALNYSGRSDILQTSKRLAEMVACGYLTANDIDEQLFSRTSSMGFAPDPDLIIRTSGEYRLSNFMLWQSAYSELYFTNKMWPEFSEDDFDQALFEFSKKERRFGKTGEQLKKQPLVHLQTLN